MMHPGLIASLYIFSSDFPQSERDVLIKRTEVVRFYSEIDDDSVRRLDNILKNGDLLDIHGPGGLITSTIEMADIVRDRKALVKVSGECFSGCSIVWATAIDRVVDGFHALTFHGSPISSLAWFKANPTAASEQEMRDAEINAAALEELLHRAGVQSWLFHCSYRLMGNEWTVISTDTTLPSSQRISGSARFSRVWFPREILEAAGIDDLEKFDPPSEAQKERFETQNGPNSARVRIYWAEPDDCDLERAAYTPSE